MNKIPYYEHDWKFANNFCDVHNLNRNIMQSTAVMLWTKKQTEWMLFSGIACVCNWLLFIVCLCKVISKLFTKQHACLFVTALYITIQGTTLWILYSYEHSQNSLTNTLSWVTCYTALFYFSSPKALLHWFMFSGC